MGDPNSADLAGTMLNGMRIILFTAIETMGVLSQSTAPFIMVRISSGLFKA